MIGLHIPLKECIDWLAGLVPVLIIELVPVMTLWCRHCPVTRSIIMRTITWTILSVVSMMSLISVSVRYSTGESVSSITLPVKRAGETKGEGQCQSFVRGSGHGVLSLW